MQCLESVLFESKRVTYVFHRTIETGIANVLGEFSGEEQDGVRNDVVTDELAHFEIFAQLLEVLNV